MADLESLIAQTKARVGELIQKPKMTDKLLNKPPFRFLHDTISAISSATGFGEGLYSGSELDSGSIGDKNSKIAYLEKCFNLVGICLGAPLDIRANKVVSGLEPECTNSFLIALAECAADAGYDSAEAVRRCLDGEAPGQGPRPLRSGNAFPAAEAKSDGGGGGGGAKFDSGGNGAGMQEDFKSPSPADAPLAAAAAAEERGGGGSKEVPMEAKIPAEMEMIAPERGKSRGGTRGGKPNQATADAGMGSAVMGGHGASTAPNLDGEIERCDGAEATTQALLGEVITRPRLTEKLLSKPPFRFLHDIIMEVIRATNFGANLYTPEESDSANVSDKAQKMAFLEKIIKVVGLQLNTLVAANPAKIVAGREPQDTNNFLQLLAVAAKNIPDSSNAVRTVLEQMGLPLPGGGEAPASAMMDNNNNAESKPTSQEGSNFDNRFNAAPMSAMDPVPVQQQQQQQPAREVMMTADEKPSEGGDDAGDKRSTRPTTARRRPPKVKDGAKELQGQEIAPAAKKTEGIIIDGQADDDDDDDDIVDETRLAEDMMHGAEAKGGPGADAAAGDPQSKLVKDIMSRQLEQEAVGRNRVEPEEETKDSPVDGGGGAGAGSNSSSAGPAGGSGIRLGRLRKTGTDKKGGAGSSGGGGAGGDGPGGGGGHETNLEKMRASIQLLVQHTGPLGTCMDYVQEDISLMTAELHKWEEECRRYEAEYEESKRKTKESLHPLKLELAEVDDQIFELIAKVSSAKAECARNDEKIQQILKLSSTA
mmetsp:Transcript_6078/g.10124  ORF Transcript_6078/g.10124 Transcript_6078/m.10124 type:complete len:763 (+) Transcript_6078:105-2393(+)